MATMAQSVPAPPGRWTWFREFLREELAPYPGRGALVARMVIASTLAMIVTMTFRIPYGAYAAIFALQISRESPRATVQNVKTILIAFACSALYILIGAIFFLGDPVHRLLWVIGTLFLIFYALSTVTNYTAAARFGYLAIISIPLWDQHISAELRVENTLWAVGAVTVGSVITVLVELIYAELRPGDELIHHISNRLAVLKSCSAVMSPTALRARRRKRRSRAWPWSGHPDCDASCSVLPTRRNTVSKWAPLWRLSADW